MGTVVHDPICLNHVNYGVGSSLKVMFDRVYQLFVRNKSI